MMIRIDWPRAEELNRNGGDPAAMCRNRIPMEIESPDDFRPSRGSRHRAASTKCLWQLGLFSAQMVVPSANQDDNGK